MHFLKVCRDLQTFTRSNQAGLLCVLGGFLLNLCFSLDYSYANLNTYLTSYMRANGHNPGLQYKDFIFLTAAKRMTQGVFSLAGGLLSQRLGARPSLTAGCVILTLGYSLTAITLSSIFPLAVLSVGLCHGLGFCLVYATNISVAQMWFPQHIRGVITSLVVSGYGFGSLIWIPMETAFVNPGNLAPGEEGYYVDNELLARVPPSFLLMAGLLAAMAIPGLLLVREPPEGFTTKAKEKEAAAGDSMKTGSSKSLSPVQVLQTRLFYKIWLANFAIGLSQGLMVNWQKAFGLQLVTSDRFHATVGIFTSLCNGFSRIMWGLLYDRYGYRRCMLAIGMILTISISCLPLLLYCEKDGTLVMVLWILLMLAIYSSFPGQFSIMATSMNSAFGASHFRANFGLLFTITVANNCVLLLCSQVPAVFDVLDYSGMFLLAGGVGVLGLVVTLITEENFKAQSY